MMQIHFCTRKEIDPQIMVAKGGRGKGQTRSLGLNRHMLPYIK